MVSTDPDSYILHILYICVVFIVIFYDSRSMTLTKWKICKKNIYLKYVLSNWINLLVKVRFINWICIRYLSIKA